jgi:hypothetical protein
MLTLSDRLHPDHSVKVGSGPQGLGNVPTNPVSDTDASQEGSAEVRLSAEVA